DETDRIRIVEDAMADLAPGDVFLFGRGRWAVLSVAHRKGTVRIRAVDPHAHVSNFDPVDFDELPASVAILPLPEPFDPRNRIIERRLASALRKADLRGATTTSIDHGGSDQLLPRAVELAVASCPDFDEHLRAAADRDRLQRRMAQIDRRMSERTGSLARRLDRLLELLQRRGFVDGWSLT